MTTAALAPLQVLTPVAAAIKGLYGIASDINDYMDQHIAGMKANPSPAISRSGHVFEAAKKGFGIGYLSSATIIAAGQWLLGNHLSALGTVATAAIGLNPAVMTAAALGALIYGYSALNEREKNLLHESIGKGIELGVELVKSIIRFAIDTAKQLLSKENRDEMKKMIRDTAAMFGRTLGQVTGKLTDKFADGATVVTGKTRRLVQRVSRKGPREAKIPPIK
ncbi:MAG: hypothetical protein WD793_05625 [Steroidobacteraceae bacterium]